MAGTVTDGESFSHYVRRCMTEVGMTYQHELMTATGYSQGYVSKLMRGKADVNTEVARKLAAALQRPIEEVERMAGLEHVEHEENVPARADLRLLANTARSLEPEDVELLNGMASMLRRRKEKLAQKRDPRPKHT